MSNLMSKNDQLEILTKERTQSFVCAHCTTAVFGNIDDVDFVPDHYRRGWRMEAGAIYCPECILQSNSSPTNYKLIVCFDCKVQTVIFRDAFNLASLAGWNIYQKRYYCNICSEKHILAERGYL